MTDRMTILLLLTCVTVYHLLTIFFTILFQNPSSSTFFPSLLAHQSSLQLIHPIHVIPAHSSYLRPFPALSNFEPMQNEMPCDVHFLNLRTMQNRDDGKDRLIPMNTAALFLHRLGYDCSFPNKGLSCASADGQVSF